MAYSILIGEMAKNKISRKALADTLGLHRNTVAYKLEKGSFSIEEAEKILNNFFPGFPIMLLFTKDL